MISPELLRRFPFFDFMNKAEIQPSADSDQSGILISNTGYARMISSLTGWGLISLFLHRAFNSQSCESNIPILIVMIAINRKG
jgi:hypothetical protein